MGGRLLASDENAEFTLGLWGRFVRASGARHRPRRPRVRDVLCRPARKDRAGRDFAVSDGEGNISRGYDAVVPADVLEKAKKQSAFYDAGGWASGVLRRARPSAAFWSMHVTTRRAAVHTLRRRGFR
ncbi:MAG: hypothetical protein ACLS9I_09115 [Adlercreutzia equolifaciens]